jgi:hypothetical protein
MSNSLTQRGAAPKLSTEESVVSTEALTAGSRHDHPMDASGLDDIPRAYRLGLRLRALGADDQLIAECLGIDVGSVAALVDIGARKLEHVQEAARLKGSTDVDHTSGR